MATLVNFETGVMIGFVIYAFLIGYAIAKIEKLQKKIEQMEENQNGKHI